MRLSSISISCSFIHAPGPVPWSHCFELPGLQPRFPLVAKVSPRGITTSANRIVTCLYSLYDFRVQGSSADEYRPPCLVNHPRAGLTIAKHYTYESRIAETLP